MESASGDTQETIFKHYSHMFEQAYDILYFKTGQSNNSAIMEDISKGEVLYEV